MQNDAKKSSFKIWFNRILDINAIKIDYVCVETNVFVIRFYSLYLVYYVKNIVYLQYKIIILLIYCIKCIKIFNKKIKYFANKSEFFKSIFSKYNCTMIVVEEIKMIRIVLFHHNFGLKLFNMVYNEIILQKIFQKMKIQTKKSSFKNLNKRILDINVVKMDFIRNETKVYKFIFYSLYWVYCIHYLVFQQNKLSISLVYCIKNIKYTKYIQIFNSKITYIFEHITIFCTYILCLYYTIVVREIISTIIWLFPFVFRLNMFMMVNKEIILTKVVEKMKNNANDLSFKNLVNHILYINMREKWIMFVIMMK